MPKLEFYFPTDLKVSLEILDLATNMHVSTYLLSFSFQSL